MPPPSNGDLRRNLFIQLSVRDCNFQLEIATFSSRLQRGATAKRKREKMIFFCCTFAIYEPQATVRTSKKRGNHGTYASTEQWQLLSDKHEPTRTTDWFTKGFSIITKKRVGAQKPVEKWNKKRREVRPSLKKTR